MATVIGLTASRMQEIEAASIVDAEVVAGNLILTKHDGTPINAGPVMGPQGPVGPQGPQSTGMPGEMKLWPGSVLPVEATYGLWTWANGGIFNVVDYPLAAAHIDPAWKTAHGQSDPGAGKFRVPDLRGLVPAGLDAMPGGSRANRMTRAVAITIAAKTGEETHVVAVSEMPSHSHLVNSHSHGGSVVAVGDHGHSAWTDAQGNHNHDQSWAGRGYLVSQYGVAQYGTAGANVSSVSGILSNAGDSGTHAHNVGVSNGGAHGHGIPAEAPGTNGQGGSGAHENVQPTVFVPYIVKLDD